MTTRATESEDRLRRAGVELSLITNLRSTIDQARALVEELEAKLASISEANNASSDVRLAELESRVADAESDRRLLSAQLIEFEQKTNRLLNLYVATYQLHASLEVSDVRDAIAEIATNLLGAEQFILLLRRGVGVACDVIIAEGLDEGWSQRLRHSYYPGGQAIIDECLADGVRRMGYRTAVIPLNFRGVCIGALVILKMVDHKPELGPDDRDLLDLLAAHAASALYAAQSHVPSSGELKIMDRYQSIAPKVHETKEAGR
jgi:hypothetical protein